MRKTLYLGLAGSCAVLGLALSWFTADVDITQPNQGRKINYSWGLWGFAIGFLVSFGADCCADKGSRWMTQSELKWIEEETQRAIAKKQHALNALNDFRNQFLDKS